MCLFPLHSFFLPLEMIFADAAQTTADEIRKMADAETEEEGEGERDERSPLRTCLVFDDSAFFA